MLVHNVRVQSGYQAPMSAEDPFRQLTRGDVRQAKEVLDNSCACKGWHTILSLLARPSAPVILSVRTARIHFRDNITWRTDQSNIPYPHRTPAGHRRARYLPRRRLRLHRRQAQSSWRDRKSTRLNSSHDQISYAVFCLKKKKRERPSPRMSRPNSGHATCCLGTTPSRACLRSPPCKCRPAARSRGGQSGPSTHTSMSTT